MRRRGKGRKEKKNIIIKGVSREKGELRWDVERVFKEMGVKARINEMKKIGAGVGSRGDMMWIRLEKEEIKKKIWEKKKKLKGSKIWIDEDLTKERKTRWRLKEIAKEEREKRKNMWVERNKIRIEGEWWELWRMIRGR